MDRQAAGKLDLVGAGDKEAASGQSKALASVLYCVGCHNRVPTGLALCMGVVRPPLATGKQVGNEAVACWQEKKLRLSPGHFTSAAVTAYCEVI